LIASFPRLRRARRDNGPDRVADPNSPALKQAMFHAGRTTDALFARKSAAEPPGHETRASE